MNLSQECPPGHVVTVTGATGKTGRHVVAGARARGWGVRRATRHPSDADDVFFDWSDASSWEPAFAGSHAAYVVVPFNDPVAPDTAPQLLETVGGAGVPRVVLLSSLDVETADEDSPLRVAENTLSTLDVASAAIRPTWFFDNFTSGSMSWMVAAGRLELPAGEGTIPYVDVRDVSEVALAALTPGGPTGPLEITGPQQVHHREIAEVLGGALGRPIEYRPVADEEFVSALTAQGFSDGYARFLGDAMSAVAGGHVVIPVTDTVLRTTGRPPFTLEGFAAEFAALSRSR